MNYKIAIFDLDGTILNTIEDLADSTNYVLKQNGMPERTLEEINSFVGNGIRKLIERAVPADTTEETIDKVYKEFSNYYKKHCADKTKPYEGITEVIEELRKRDIKTAVVSNKADFAVQILCRDYFPGLFDCCVGDREGQKRKPYPDSVNDVLKKFEIDKEEAVYIGDSDVDIDTARNASMDGITVSWGFRGEEFLRKCGANVIVKEPKELLQYFQGK